MAIPIAPVPRDLMDLGEKGRWFEDLRREVNSLATTGGIDHLLLANIGTNTHAQIDVALSTALSHRQDSTIHFTEASLDHTAIANIGTNSHAQIDTAITASTSHIADSTIHFTLLDEDSMVSDSAISAPSQQSVKAFVEAAVLAEDFWQRSGTTISVQTAGDSLDIDGAALFNSDFGDNDFTINKETSGTALVYDASVDRINLSSDVVFDNAVGLRWDTTTEVNKLFMEVNSSDVFLIGTNTSTVYDTINFRLGQSTTEVQFDTAENTFNIGYLDRNFAIRKMTSGTAFLYDAGTDKTTQTGDWKTDTFKYLDADTGGANNLFLGVTNNTGNTGEQNLFMAAYAGQNNIGGKQGVAIGSYALHKNTEGDRNSAIGSNALYTNTTGFDNSAQGAYALQANTIGHSNTAQGSYALYRGTAPYTCAAQGLRALEYANASGNTGTGAYAGQYVDTGKYNTISGYQAMRGTVGNKVTGWRNVSIGYQSAASFISGDDCIFIGSQIDADSATADFQLKIGSVISGDMTSGSEYVNVTAELHPTAMRETKVTSSATETLSVKDSTYIEIDTASNTLTLSNMVDGSKIQLNNSSSGDANLSMDIKVGTSTFSAPVTMASGDSYELTYDLGTATWVM